MLETLATELDQLDNEYSSNFAGQSRMTRDVALLDRIITRGNDIVKRIDQIPSAAQGPELVRLRDAAKNNLALYAQERGAILRAQEVGPTFEQFSLEATSANLVFGRYARHFAGKDRATRDLALLGELVDDLKQIDKRMGALLEEHRVQDFQRDREVVVQNLQQYQKEIPLIENAQKSGTPEERASVLASLANNQFAVYQTHFAGEPRISRRPALLMRIISSLKSIKERMVAFQQGGLNLEFNDKNIAIVEDRLKTYDNELGEVRKLRQATPMTEIMGELGGAANKLFETYRASFANKPRQQVDTDLLGGLCDKLGEIRRQMSDMARAEDNEMNDKNLEIVTEQLVMFEGEYEAVVASKAQAQPATPGNGNWAKADS
jgi:predicted translin family RNA/ssDNA-binding protein